MNLTCRNCKKSELHKFVDLGFCPPSNSFLDAAALLEAEIHYPLTVFVCTDCWLCQTHDYLKREDFFSNSYVYFSSTSKSWLQHASNFVDLAISRFELNESSFVYEIASNDGYLLRNFVKKGIPNLGIEPTDSTANEAEKFGVRTIRKFFSTGLALELAKSHPKADLLVANNVYAHVPDINDFTLGIKNLLNADGVVSIEFPHLLNLLRYKQFDTIYHEHYSYLSLSVATQIFEKNGLRIFDVEKIATHGGSLRIYGCHDDAAREASPSVLEILNEENRSGLTSLATYKDLQTNAESIKLHLLEFLVQQKIRGNRVVGFGAAAKGNTLLNFSGVGKDLLFCVIDSSPSKHGKYLPGSHIPVISPDDFQVQNGDQFLILPWNIADELVHEIVRRWPNAQDFWKAVPAMEKIFH